MAFLSQDYQQRNPACRISRLPPSTGRLTPEQALRTLRTCVAALARIEQMDSGETYMIETSSPGADDTRAIMCLLSEYGRLLDMRDAKGWAALFAPEGEWVGGDHYGVIAGRERLADFVTREFARTPPCVHMLGNYAITGNSEVARVWSRWLLIEQGDAGLRLALAGHYSDSLVKLAEGWRFLRREVTLDLPAGT